MFVGCGVLVCCMFCESCWRSCGAPYFYVFVVVFFVFLGGMCCRVLFCLGFGCVCLVVLFVCFIWCWFCLCSSVFLCVVVVVVFVVVVLVFGGLFVLVLVCFL